MILSYCVRLLFNSGLACEALASGKLLWKVRPKHHKFLGLMAGSGCHGVCVCVNVVCVMVCVFFLCDNVHGISMGCVLSAQCIFVSTKA